MRKVIKYSLHTLSVLVLTAIALPVVAMLILYIPPVQNALTRALTEKASELLGTTVKVEGVNIEFFNRVTLHGLYVEDPGADTLLYTKKLSAGISLHGLLGKPLRLGDVELDTVRLYMHQDPDSTSNLKKLIERLRNPDKKEKSAFSLRAKSLTIRDMSYRMRKLEVVPRGGAVNFTDIDAWDVNLVANGISMDGDSVSMSIGHISLKEKSGFRVDDFSVSSFTIAPSGQFYEDLYFLTPDSEVTLPYLRLVTGTWDSYKDYINKVVMQSEVRDSRVSFRTIARFAPSLQNWQSVLEGVNATIDGTVADMRGEVKYARTLNTEISAAYEIQGIPDIDRTRFVFDIRNLTSNIPDVQIIMADIAGKPLPQKLEERSAAVGTIHLTGHFDGLLKNFRADAVLNTSDGSATFDASLLPAADARTAVHGNIAVQGIDIGHLLDVKKLGRTSLSAGVDGYFNSESFVANTDLELASLVFNGYDYHNIDLHGVIRDKLFSGRIKSSDQNLTFDFDGTLDFNDSIPRYDFGMDLRYADLHALNFNRRDSVSVVEARLDATARGTSLDDLDGRIVIDRLLYVNSHDSTRTGRMTITGENSANSKRLLFNSAFADADYRSRTDYKTVAQDLREMLHNYMPTLAPREYDPERRRAGGVADANNFSMLNVNIKRANNIAAIFLPGFMIAENSKLAFTFNPNTGYVSLKASSRFIEWGDNFIDNMIVDVGNRGDSIALYASAADMYTAGLRLPRFSVNGGVKDNRLTVQAGMSDTARVYSALLNVAAVLQRDTLSGIPQAYIRILPSRIMSNDKMWTIAGRNIVADSTMVDIGNFRIAGPDQSLQIYGRAGRNKTDTLHLNMSKFELEPFSQFTSRMGYNVQGVASGHADLVSAMRESMLQARVEFDSVRVNETELPPGLFESRWDFDNNRAGMLLTGRRSGDTIIRGFFAPKDGKYAARIKLRDFDLSLIDPMFKGVIGNTEGIADADVTVRGEKRQPSFNGEIKIPEITTTVDFMQVPYTIANATIRITDNILSLPAAILRDPEGNRSGIDMKVDLRSLSNVRYEFNVRPNRLLVLNTTADDNEMFYGHVYATGAASIKGDRAGVNMNIRATTESNSRFFLPLGDQTTMGVSDIITFVNPKHDAPDSSDYLFRKRTILERRERKQSEALASNVNIGMELNILPNTEFQMLIDPRAGHYMTGRGTGSLTLNVNPNNDEFTIYGDYEITEGIYYFTLQEILRKQFAIEQGSRIVFTGDPMDAILDVTAVYKLKASLAPLLETQGVSTDSRRAVPVECRIMIKETLLEPEITFSVEVPGLDPETQAKVSSALGTQESMATQFLALLAANSFIAGGGVGNIGTMGGAATAIDFLSSQLANILSNPYFDIGIRYTPGMEDISGDVVTVDLSTQLFSNRLLLEMEGNYDNSDTRTVSGNSQRNTSNISGNFSLTWIIDRTGNLRARGFTRTVDRFDKDPGTQESGIGLYYREDFNRLSDIPRNFRERFKSRKRRQAEEEARQAMMDADSMLLPPPLDTLAPAGTGQPRESSGGNDGENRQPADATRTSPPAAVSEEERQNE